MTGLDEALLDDEEALGQADSAHVLRALAGAGAQVRQAIERTAESVPDSARFTDRPRAVIVAGRGGSALVADALAALIGPSGPVPVVALTGGALPAWVGALDLVVAVSMSGRAEGAVSIAAEAGRRGASVLSVSTPDSPLGEVSARYRAAHVAVPQRGNGAIPIATTRTGLWSMLTPALLLCSELGLIPDGPDTGPAGLSALADALDAEAEACRPASPAFVNPAKALAMELHNTVPVVLGNGPMATVAAHRAAAALARTARIPAAFGALPDDAGDVVATFGGPFAAREHDVFADPFVDGPSGPLLRLLMLTLAEDRTETVVADIAQRNGVRVSDVRSDQDTPLRTFGQVVARVDFAATYLALAGGHDPSVNPQVADLRDALR
ncbi:MAG: phosphosugar isomerase [Micrococcales bacterium]|nr:MAG: phosphosugar isomerase [Micrococcales bacterium]PIE27799.1 MAG: phosphosugar isomerase [Micrococcales bacterium]